MNFEAILKREKKSVTPERVKLFGFMVGKHLFSAQDLEMAFPELSRASIFRSLKLFVEIGVLRRVQLGEKAENYEINHRDSHHEHMKCISCGKVTSFDSDFICKLLSQVAKNYNFTLKEHSINLLGSCKNCS